jgi:hypothetical protein
VEPGNDWGKGEGWPNVVRLIELAKQAPPEPLSQERRAQIIQQVIARVEKNREQRRVRLAFAAGAAAIVVIGLLLKLVSVGVPWLRSPTEMAEKGMRVHPAAE